MKKQRNKIILLLLLLLVLYAIHFFRSPPIPTFVYGSLAAADVSDIEGVVRQDIRHRLCPSFSWANIKNLPSAAKSYFGHHLEAVSKKEDGSVEVNVRYQASSKWIKAEIYTLQKSSKGWQITGNQLLVK